MAITITEAAAKRVEAFLSNRGKGIGIRLSVRTCRLFRYGLRDGIC